MYKLKIFLITFILGVGSCTMDENRQKEAREFNLKDHIWKKRIVIAYSESFDVSSYMAFIRSWDNSNTEIQERDMILVSLFAEGQSLAIGEPLKQSSAKKLKKRFDFGRDDFELVLIGKDGTVKWRGSGIKLNEIFSFIDRMPMRRQEMRRK